jgi:hypothetical protein
MITYTVIIGGKILKVSPSMGIFDYFKNSYRL